MFCIYTKNKIYLYIMKKKSSVLSNISFEPKTPISIKSLETTRNKMYSTILVSVVIRIIIFSVFLSYILNLEKDRCQCSKGWERSYIKYFSLTIIIFSLIEIIFSKVYYKLIMVHNILGLGSIIFIYAVLKYVHDLKKEDCECSINWKRSLLNFYAWMTIALLLVGVITIFFMTNTITR